MKIHGLPDPWVTIFFIQNNKYLWSKKKDKRVENLKSEYCENYFSLRKEL